MLTVKNINYQSNIQKIKAICNAGINVEYYETNNGEVFLYLTNGSFTMTRPDDVKSSIMLRSEGSMLSITKCTLPYLDYLFICHLSRVNDKPNIPWDIVEEAKTFYVQYYFAELVNMDRQFYKEIYCKTAEPLLECPMTTPIAHPNTKTKCCFRYGKTSLSEFVDIEEVIKRNHEWENDSYLVQVSENKRLKIFKSDEHPSKEYYRLSDKICTMLKGFIQKLVFECSELQDAEKHMREIERMATLARAERVEFVYKHPTSPETTQHRYQYSGNNYVYEDELSLLNKMADHYGSVIYGNRSDGKTILAIDAKINLDLIRKITIESVNKTSFTNIKLPSIDILMHNTPLYLPAWSSKPMEKLIVYTGNTGIGITMDRRGYEKYVEFGPEFLVDHKYVKGDSESFENGVIDFKKYTDDHPEDAEYYFDDQFVMYDKPREGLYPLGPKLAKLLKGRFRKLPCLSTLDNFENKVAKIVDLIGVNGLTVRYEKIMNY